MMRSNRMLLQSLLCQAPLLPHSELMSSSEDELAGFLGDVRHPTASLQRSATMRRRPSGVKPELTSAARDSTERSSGYQLKQNCIHTEAVERLGQRTC